MQPRSPALSPAVLAPNDTVTRRSYLLLEEIGRGATGTVWRARARATGREYAVKILHETQASAPKAVARFLQERAILLRLRHENLVAVHDLLTTAEGAPALVLDLVTGGSLRDLLRQRRTLPPAEAARLLAQVAAGLTAAHEANIVHRDLKPDNILLAPRMDGGTRARLTDFGIARVGDGSHLTTTGAVLGTPNYMAPEVIEGKPARTAADVYALGIMLYELLVGRPPFDDDCDTAILIRHTRATARATVGMPPRFWTLIESCLDRVPARRPTAAALVKRLNELADDSLDVPALDPAPVGTTYVSATGALVPDGRGPISVETGPVDEPDPLAAATPDLPGTAEPVGTPDEPPARNALNGGRVPAQPARRHVRRLWRRHGSPRLARRTSLIVIASLLAAVSAYTTTRFVESTSVDTYVVPKGVSPPVVSGTTPDSGEAHVGGRASVAAAARNTADRQAPAATHTSAAIPEAFGPWQCSPAYQWSVSQPVLGTTCHAIGSTVYVTGKLQSAGGLRIDAAIAVINVETGQTAAGPFGCRGLRFTREISERRCGPFAASLRKGHHYRTVTRWTYPEISVLPEGVVEGNKFTW